VSVRRRQRTRAVGDSGSTDLSLRRSSLGLFCRRGRLGLRGGSFFRTKRFDPRGLETCCFRDERLLLRSEVGRSLSGLRRDGGLFLRSGLNVGRFPTPANGVGCRGHQLRDGLRDSRRTTTTRNRRGSRLLFRTDTLLAFPASANASDLVVGEHAHVATNGNVHLPKKRDYFFG
jgi:hypothetical protein